jgi:hypothetical protein
MNTTLLTPAAEPAKALEPASPTQQVADLLSARRAPAAPPTTGWVERQSRTSPLSTRYVAR